jgi:MoaA/NifB/PqqE/SkfB family radical SAM enzyme
MEEISELGVDFMILKGLNTAVDETLKVTSLSEIQNRIDRAAQALRVARNFTVALDFDPPNPEHLRCRWPWTGIYLTAEGDLTPCCNCPDARTVSFGNIFEQTFDEIWNGKPYRAFRKSLRIGIPEICQRCPDY